MHAHKIFRLAACSVAAVSMLTVGGCGHARTPSTVTTSPSSGAVDPNAPEVVEPGDIPDNQVFVTYTAPDRTFAVDIPEGWARSGSGKKVTFTDKYNSITITNGPATTAPTRASVTERGLADVRTD